MSKRSTRRTSRPEVKEQLAQIDKLVGEYVKRTQEITTKKTEIFGADKKAAAENMTPSELVGIRLRAQ